MYTQCNLFRSFFARHFFSFFPFSFSGATRRVMERFTLAWHVIMILLFFYPGYSFLGLYRLDIRSCRVFFIIAVLLTPSRLPSCRSPFWQLSKNQFHVTIHVSPSQLLFIGQHIIQNVVAAKERPYAWACFHRQIGDNLLRPSATRPTLTFPMLQHLYIKENVLMIERVCDVIGINKKIVPFFFCFFFLLGVDDDWVRYCGDGGGATLNNF